MGDEPKTPPPAPADAADASPLKGFPWGKLWVLVGALMTLATSTVISHFQADSKKGEAVEESKKNSKEEVKAVTPATNATVEEVKQLKQLVAELAIEQQRERERGAVRRKKTKAPADTAKVKGAQDDASATLKAIKVKALTPNPALAPVPEAPPAKPPAPSTSPADAKSP